MRVAKPWFLALVLAACSKQSPPEEGYVPTPTPAGDPVAAATATERGRDDDQREEDKSAEPRNQPEPEPNAPRLVPPESPPPLVTADSLYYASNTRAGSPKTETVNGQEQPAGKDAAGWADDLAGKLAGPMKGDDAGPAAGTFDKTGEERAALRLPDATLDAKASPMRGAEDKELELALDGRLDRGTLIPLIDNDTELTFAAPSRLLPRTFYFENTYLGGSAAYAERLRRLSQDLVNETRPYEIVQAEVQPFDPPRTEGLAVTASVDATHVDRPQRVFLQVGLRGSARYGWRRPPLDVVLVVDHPALQRGPEVVTSFVVDVLRQLGPADRLGIVLAGNDPATFLELTRLTSAQQHLAQRIDDLRDPGDGNEGDLARAMSRAGEMLELASDEEATVPGSRTILLLSGAQPAPAIEAAAHAAHTLTVQGCVTSVFALDVAESGWWQVANAGYGNLHRVTAEDFSGAIDAEMKSLARVVARLVRVNVRLGKETNVIRVLGTRVLEAREVDEVKARERATDINLSKSLGITSDRGEDDDGIQTVIPYFYGDDSHVILMELWVTGPGVVADVTVRYKDMVNLENATARASVKLGARPQPATPEQLVIARNVHGFELAENLQKASDAIMRNDLGEAVRNLGAATSMAAETNALDRQAVQGLKSMVERGDWQSDAARRATVQETLLISGQRRVGDTNQQK